MLPFVTFHVPDAPALTRALALDDVVGRDPGCEICIAHASISRRHAQFQRDPDGAWAIVDLGSKNGLRLDGQRVQRVELDSGRWFAIGDVYAQFELVSPQLAESRASSVDRRRTASQTMRALLAADPRDSEHLKRSLAAFVELAECRRGFVLGGNGRHAFGVLARHDADEAPVDAADFDGSSGVLQRCVQERRALFVSNLPDAAWLKGRASIVAGGVRAAACLPLLDGGDLLGLLYADTDEGARVFDALDAELLGAFADDIASWLAAQALDARVDALGARLRDQGDAS